MNHFLYISIGYGSLYVVSARYCFSTEDYNEYKNKHYHTNNNDDDDDDVDEKIFPDWFHLPYSDVCKENREFTNNMCSYRFTHKLPLSCVICKNVNVDYYCRYHYNSTCSHECCVKSNTLLCNDCQKSGLSLRYSLCYTLIKQMFEKYNPKQLKDLANK